MPKMTNEQIASQIVDRILGNLAQSDFVTNAGGNAMKELREFKQDMINDAAIVLNEQK